MDIHRFEIDPIFVYLEHFSYPPSLLVVDVYKVCMGISSYRSSSSSMWSRPFLSEVAVYLLSRHLERSEHIWKHPWYVDFIADKKNM